jgi:hypothetical protein
MEGYIAYKQCSLFILLSYIYLFKYTNTLYTRQQMKIYASYSPKLKTVLKHNLFD